jgi:hypothetical protein
MSKSTITVQMPENSWEKVQRALTELILVYESDSEREDVSDFAKSAHERRLRMLRKVRKRIADQI